MMTEKFIQETTKNLPLSKTCIPKDYIQSGWISIYRNKIGKPADYEDDTLEVGGQLEHWSTADKAEIKAVLPPSKTECWFLILNLRSAFRLGKDIETLRVNVNGYQVQDFSIKSDSARETLIEIPSSWLNEINEVLITLSTPDAISCLLYTSPSPRD